MLRAAVRAAIAAAFLSTGCLAAEETVQRSPVFELDGGMDARFRYEFKDNWMDKGKTSVNPAYEDFYRMRTRVWGLASAGDDWGTYLRLGNEFRGYRNSPDNDKNKFPDELFVDNLYMDFDVLADRTDLRVGRQDIKEGAGRVISDGTPGDGSRSAYFDSVLAKVKLLEKSDVDLMGTWNQGHDTCTLGNPHDIYDLTKIRSGNPYSDMEEKGLMAYFHYNELPGLPVELYWVWKQETRFYDASTRYPGREFHTFGTRLIPKFSDTLSGEAEVAVQVGNVEGQPEMERRDIFAYLGYAGLTYSQKEWAAKPRLTGALLVLSGDEDSYYKTANGSADNGWNPTFNRTVWLSEICATMYDQNRWSNLVYPHLEAAVEPASKQVVKFQTGPMFAAEKDSGAADRYRGYFSQLRYEFPLLAEVFGKRGDVAGAVVGEALFYGDYYQHSSAAVDESVASWLRFEVSARF